MEELSTQLRLVGIVVCQKEVHLAEIVPFFYLCLNYEDLSVIKEAIKSLKSLV